MMQLNWEMEGCPQGAHTPCGVSGHRAAWLHVGQDWAGTRVTGAGTAWRVSWLALVLGGTVGCCHPMGETSPRLLGGWCRRGQEQALGAGMWGLSAHPAHVCCSRVRPQPLLPGPQMVARKRRPVPPPSVHHHASLAPWPHSPAGTQGWKQLGHPEPGCGAPSAWPPMGHSTPPGSHPTLAKG